MLFDFVIEYYLLFGLGVLDNPVSQNSQRFVSFFHYGGSALVESIQPQPLGVEPVDFADQFQVQIIQLHRLIPRSVIIIVMPDKIQSLIRMVGFGCFAFNSKPYLCELDHRISEWLR